MAPASAYSYLHTILFGPLSFKTYLHMIEAAIVSIAAPLF